MSTHRYLDRICAIAAVCAVLLTFLLYNGEALGVQPVHTAMGYETRLFDTSRVHTLDIVMDDWDGFLETCMNEEYAACAVVIDNEAYQNIAIRAKGNTSLSMVSSMNSDRYSFKLEFDHYDSGKSYYGLDKLCLNNLIQDNTLMKDYLTYRMMGLFGAAAPLCSYVYITVNGEDWGLYLAVEGVEEAFLQRNYGNEYGDLYKPDSLNMGGGRGNGKDFRMSAFNADSEESEQFPSPPDGFPSGEGMPWGEGMPDGAGGMPEGMPAPDGGMDAPPDLPAGDMPAAGSESRTPDGAENAGDRQSFRGMGGGFGGMGSADVKLQYVDDDPDSYANIFDSAKTDVTDMDKSRLIQALKQLGESPGESVDVEQVIRYFVVHNFVCNGDSYTGSMVHNYYLYEENGLLSMIPWDYNLAFGGFQGRDASGSVNDPIDTPLSVTGSGDRPMMDWILSSEEYTELYHQYFSSFLETVDCEGLIAEARALIAPYVERDPSKFCTYEEFELGVDTLAEFCRLRRESVAGQLDGTIPSTDEGQAADPSALVDAGGLTVSAMGSMNQGRAGGGTVPANGEPFRREGGDAGAPGAPPEMERGEQPVNAPVESAGSSAGGWMMAGGFLLALLAAILVARFYRR